MSKRKFSDICQEDEQDEYKRLELDIVSSYIMTLFGNYMDKSIDIIKSELEKYFKNKKIEDMSNFEYNIFQNMNNINNLKTKVLSNNNKNSELINALFDYNGGDNSKIQKKFANEMVNLKNTVIGLCLEPGSYDAHWIYIDENSKIHNSYNNALQVNNSNQFCQCFGILMGINPFYRKNFRSTINSYKFGFTGLIKLWKIILKPILSYSVNKTYNNMLIHKETLQIVHRVNMGENQYIVKSIMQKYMNKDEEYLYDEFFKVLTTDYAYDNAPYFY